MEAFLHSCFHVDGSYIYDSLEENLTFISFFPFSLSSDYSRKLLTFTSRHPRAVAQFSTFNSYTIHVAKISYTIYDYLFLGLFMIGQFYL